MINKFKKYFIPHKENDHKPYILRWKVALVFLSVLLLVETFFLVQIYWLIPFSVSTDSRMLASIIPEAIINSTNQYRTDYDLKTLKINPLLEEAAQLKAKDMVEKSYFSHTSPEGLTSWYWLEKVGYPYNSMGENLAINFVDSQDAVDAWMNSVNHKDNMLNNNFTEIGVGTAKGEYKGKETIFIVQLFAIPTVSAEKIVLSQNKVVNDDKDNVNERPILSETEKQKIKDKDVLLLKEEINTEQNLFIKGWLAKPRVLTNFLYFVLLTIILLALTLKVFVKIKIQKPALIVNGILLLLAISSIIWLNQYIALNAAMIY